MMKKKILLGALAALLCLALVSCDDASMDKLASLMGDMGSNVYGITPSMVEVEAVSNKIDTSVSTKVDETTGESKIVFDLNSASEIISTLSTIATSPQKINQTKENLKTEIKVEDQTSEQIQQALQDKLEEVKNSLPKTSSSSGSESETESSSESGSESTSTTELDPKVEEVIEQVSEALTKISENIPAEPTQADLATVVIINSLAEEAKSMEKIDTSDTEALLPIVNKALAALDALKVTTEAANLDVLGEFDITSLLGSSSETEGKAVNEAEEEWMKYLDQLQDNVHTLISLFADKDSNGVYKVNEVKYQRMLLQMSAIRSTYEIAAAALMPNINGIAEDIYKNIKDDVEIDKETLLKNVFVEGNLKNKRDFNLNDLTLYLLSVVVTEADEFYKAIADKDLQKDILPAFLEKNEDNLKQDPLKKLEGDEIFDVDEFSIETEAQWSYVNGLCKDAVSLVRTTYVIILESGQYGTFVKLVAGEKDLETFLSELLFELLDSTLK